MNAGTASFEEKKKRQTVNIYEKAKTVCYSLED